MVLGKYWGKFISILRGYYRFRLGHLDIIKVLDYTVLVRDFLKVLKVLKVKGLIKCCKFHKNICTPLRWSGLEEFSKHTKAELLQEGSFFSSIYLPEMFY